MKRERKLVTKRIWLPGKINCPKYLAPFQEFRVSSSNRILLKGTQDSQKGT
jgi:hypothetical protein